MQPVLVHGLASPFGDALRRATAKVLAALHVDAQVSGRFAFQVAFQLAFQLASVITVAVVVAASAIAL